MDLFRRRLLLVPMLFASHAQVVPFDVGQLAAARPPQADFTIVAGDYYLHLPPAVPAGWRTVRFHSTGRDFHHAVFLGLRDSQAAATALAALAGWQEDWDRPVPGTTSSGGVEGAFVLTPTGERPGEDTYAILDLRPGLYLVLCMIPSAGQLHATRGMHALLRVTGGGAPTATPQPPPVPDATLQAADYAYRLSPTRLSPGWRLVQVTNAGPAEHVAEVGRLRPGLHLADVLTPAPDSLVPEEGAEVATIGGSPRLAAQRRAFIWLHLAPGAYVIQCPLRSAHATPHLRLGMITEFAVR